MCCRYYSHSCHTLAVWQRKNNLSNKKQEDMSLFTGLPVYSNDIFSKSAARGGLPHLIHVLTASLASDFACPERLHLII